MKINKLKINKLNNDIRLRQNRISEGKSCRICKFRLRKYNHSLQSSRHGLICNDCYVDYKTYHNNKSDEFNKRTYRYVNMLYIRNK